MPLITSPTYRAPWGLSNGHLQTILPVIFRRALLITHERERIATPDGDFLDLDWNRDQRSDSLVIITHGLEATPPMPPCREWHAPSIELDGIPWLGTSEDAVER